MKILLVSGGDSDFSTADPIERYAMRISEILRKRVNIEFAGAKSSSLLSRLECKRRVERMSKDFDAVHITTQGLGYLCGSLDAPAVVTCHDLIPFLFPRASFQEYLQKRSVKNSAKADGIISVSQNTKKDILSMLHCPETRVRVILQGLDKIFRPFRARKFCFDRNYRHILYTGSDLPHKNVPLLLKAFRRIAEKEDVKLVKTYANQKTLELIRSFGIEDKVIVTGMLPFEELPHLYNSCDLFAYPSLYDGWGLTPLEALGCGLPVVCSSASSLPEVVGSASLLFDPANERELETCILKILRDETLARELSRKGLKRARKFSWEKTAKETLAVYEELARK